jgi:hypothetical protein
MCYKVSKSVTVAMRPLIGSAASDVLPSGVALLDPEEMVFAGMIEGWSRQLRSRQLKESSVTPRLSVIRALAKATNRFPWQWTPGDLEFFTELCNSAGNRVSTIRGKQNTISMFCSFLTDDRYEWRGLCRRLFEAEPTQICHEWNTVSHSSEYEGDP